MKVYNKQVALQARGATVVVGVRRNRVVWCFCLRRSDVDARLAFHNILPELLGAQPV